jgi:serine/threonine-protein kinase HipA
MAFNVIARNQDDHVKNIALLMGRDGVWSLAPAYDVTWAFKPGNPWLDAHQMSINGKCDGFTVADLRAVARVAGLKQGRAEVILGEVSEAVAGWPGFADPAGVSEQMAFTIAESHRLALPRS